MHTASDRQTTLTFDGDPESRLYLRILTDPFALDATPAAWEVLAREGESVRRATFDATGLEIWARGQGDGVRTHIDRLRARLLAPLGTFAGVDLSRPAIMGIINVTPDSFSDGGETPDAQSAMDRGRHMRDAGAAIIDVGGESTRPGAEPVSPEEEQRRVLPVVRALAAEGATVSIDSRWAATMAAALEAGARIVNDVTALAGDPDACRVVAAGGAWAVLMHMRGEPRTMQSDPRYRAAPLDIFDFLEARVRSAEAAGIPRQRLAVDPGIGFGKNARHNAQVLAHLSLLRGIGCPLVLGVSRKSFIARLDREGPANHRLGGSLAAALAGVAQGAGILRVHDVAETRQFLAVWSGIRDGRALGDAAAP